MFTLYQRQTVFLSNSNDEAHLVSDVSLAKLCRRPTIWVNERLEFSKNEPVIIPLFDALWLGHLHMLLLRLPLRTSVMSLLQI